ncbi:helix-turn-helix domain-containing protein (plasmid) [Sinorhizobium sp. K101]|nr:MULTISPECIES: helix-turn-helix domain-containing protein [unclassified Sinorhizobium]WEJ14136.1 helix-turn-helix domain-containing protein [Sinorhizobium sp. K101]WEJ35734.1 helix-turn-helix domain-containing protein [Sinorhizobium sp. C101]
MCDIAPKWGFPHSGRFFADYRKRFGQAPSQTLQSSSFRTRPQG